MRSPRLRHLRGLLLSVLACGAAASALAQQPPLSSIRVTGDARVTAKPDRVQIDIGVTTRAALSQDAASQNAHAVDTVLAAVRKVAGPTAVLKTTSYTLNPNYRYHPKEGEPTIDGYTALNVVEVTLDDLGRIGAVIDAATQAGANRIQGIQFTLRDQDAVRAQALREAATRARAEVDVLASALGLKVLRVLTVEESSPRVMPLRVYNGAARAAAADAAPTPVEAGTLDITADVTLSVEVGPAAR
ncbi:MAG TPA: SIMPL domain-containing protein [Steroidobacteraceae bacterium]|nr:SIMPL domain-containing protein [Steroidobacteraceae bacterium]